MSLTVADPDWGAAGARRPCRFLNRRPPPRLAIPGSATDWLFQNFDLQQELFSTSI